jgi:hypothetical protein
MGINSYTVVNAIAAAVPKQYVVAGPINLVTNTPVPLSSVSQPVTHLEVYGYQSVGANTLPVANAASCWISSGGTPAVDPVPAGDKLVYGLPGGTRFDLKDLSVLGTTGDRVFLKYLI